MKSENVNIENLPLPPFNAYVVYHDHGIALAFDPRPLPQVEADWLSKFSATGRRMGAASLHVAKVAAKLQRPREEFEEEHHVEPPKAPTPAQDELLRFHGIPALGGLGALTILAACVNGIGHAPPADAARWLSGMPELAEVADRKRRR